MAGDWTPIEHATPRKPELARIAKLTGLSRRHVLGALVEFWQWAGDQTVDGHVDADVDALVLLFGESDSFWHAVEEVGWIAQTAHGIFIPRAEHWITNGAKSRLQKSKRQKQWRKARQNVDAHVDDAASTSTPRARLPEKRREEKRRDKGETPLNPPTDRSMDCAFAAWWLAVHARTGKRAARKAYDAAVRRLRLEREGSDPHEFLLERMRAFSASPRAHPEGITPIHPATWLNQGRYDDDPETWQASSPTPRKITPL